MASREIKKWQLKTQRDKLKQYQRKVESSLEKEKQLAKKLLQEGKKDRAKLILRKKAYLEKAISRTDGQLFNLEQLVHDIEYTQVETKVVQGLKAGNDALKQLHALLNIDDIEKILEETQEGIEKQRELDDLLGGIVLNDEDNSAVEAELEALLAPPEEQIIPKLPEVPTTPVEVLEEDEEVVKPKKKKEEKERTKEALLAS